jgi:hypothetical protein
MHKHLVVAIAALSLTSTAMAQNAPPSEIGNRAHGFDYQPTPNEVVPREKASGILPPTAQRDAANRDLEHIDKDLLRDEGLSTRSVPSLSTDR